MIALLALLLSAAPPATAPVNATAAADPPAAASPAETLHQAKNSFDYGSYGQAAAMADQLLALRQLDRTADQLEAYRLVGLSRFFLHQPVPARDAFLNLLSLDPDFQLDPFYVPPQAIAFFESVRQDNQALLQPIRDRRRATQEAQRQEEAARQKLLAQTRPAEAEPRVKIVNLRVERHSPALALLPFGTGQFQNGNPGLAWTLLGTEAALAGTSVACYVWYFQHGQGNGTFSPADYGTSANGPAFTVRALQIGTGAAFFALWAYGIGDAFFHFTSTVTVKEDDDGAGPPPAKPSPAKASGSQAAIVPALVPLPGGAVGALTFTF